MAEKRTGSSKAGGAPARRRRRDEGDDDANEFRSSSDVRTALIPGRTFVAKAVQYAVVDGLAMFEGDIVLGEAEEVEARTNQLRAELPLAAGVAISGEQFRWPNCRIPFTVDPALPNQQRVTDAIAHWEQHTQYRFPARTSETDFITFRPAGGCSSSVGRQGGQQFVNLGSGCATGNTIHEIGHVVGIWHEQSREDRDAFVTIHWDKIQAGFEHNFNQHVSDGDDIGPYDYGSIMHYPRNAFSVDGTDTITPVDPAAQIGQRTALSAGDIAAATSLCPPPKVLKEGPKDPLKDFKEGPKDVRIETIKETIKDIRFDTRKEQIVDTRKELVKERIKEVALDPPFGKFAGTDQIRPGQIVTQPGPLMQPAGTRVGGMPFAVVTPHAAPSAAGDTGQLEATIGELDAYASALAEQIAQADSLRDALQAQYDELTALLGQAVQAHDQSSSP